MTSETEPVDSELVLRDLTVSYGDTVVIDGLNLTVAAGETVAVIGPSGSGKSTLLRAIAGLEAVAGGVVELAGIDLASVPTHARDLGFMFQDHALFPQMDVADNIAFGLSMRGWSKTAQRDRVGELLALVGLDGYGRRSIDQLSGGEAQRVALARALAPSPRLLMLDEPLGSLDRVLREQLTIELGSLMGALDVTSLHVTHDQAEAFALADRIAVLRAGTIEQIGAPADLWRAPANRFVAEFVGHANIWTIMGETVVVPESAVRVGSAGQMADLVAVVESCAFTAGRYRLIARAEDGRAITFVHGEAAAVGQTLGLDLDERQFTSIADES